MRRSKRTIAAKIFLAIIVVLLLAFIMGLGGCDTVHKTQTNHKATSDSTRRLVKDSTYLATADSGLLQRTDSISHQEKDSAGTSSSKKTNTTKVTIWLDTSCHNVPDTPNKITVNVTGDNSVTVDIGTRKALKVVATRTSSAEHIDSSWTKMVDNTRVKNTDSSFHHDTSSISSHSEENTTVKKTESDSYKTKSKFPITTIVIGLAIVFLLLVWLRKKKLV